jgi:transposase
MIAGAPSKRRRAMTGMHKAQREVPAPTQRLFLTRREAAIELRMSLAKLDRVIVRGELANARHGLRRLEEKSPELIRSCCQGRDAREGDGRRIEEAL